MREKPLSIYPEIDIQGLFLSYDKLNSEIDQYKLSLSLSLQSFKVCQSAVP